MGRRKSHFAGHDFVERNLAEDASSDWHRYVPYTSFALPAGSEFKTLEFRIEALAQTFLLR
jgi:hypothetical protein